MTRMQTLLTESFFLWNSCNLMNQTSFAGCHGLIDPQSFITACNNTMCKYPVVDGVNCQFFEAYAKMCRLIHNITLEDWRSTTNCCKIVFHVKIFLLKQKKWFKHTEHNLQFI